MSWTDDLEDTWQREDDPEVPDSADADELASDDYRIYHMENPPNVKRETENSRKAEACIQRYFRTRISRYFQGFLHYYEPTINCIVVGFMLRYAMGGHFADLKQEAVLGILEAADHYDYSQKTPFQRYANRYIENQLHNYTRRMRRGCTVETDYAYDKLRKVMAIYNNLDGRSNAETISRVAQAAKADRAETKEMIEAALVNMSCTDIYRSYGAGDEEAEESREEITVSPEPEPYEALLKQYRDEALRTAWCSLNYREQEILSAHLGFCPECFSVLEKTGPSGNWYDCRPRKRIPYADLAAEYGLSSPESAQRICEKASIKLRTIYSEKYAQLLKGMRTGP